MIKRNDGISKDDICQNQFTAYVVLAVKRKRQSYIKKKQSEHEKETRTKKEAEQSEFRTAGYDMWSRMEPQNEKLMAAMQQLSLKERLVVTEYAGWLKFIIHILHLIFFKNRNYNRREMKKVKEKFLKLNPFGLLSCILSVRRFTHGRR